MKSLKISLNQKLGNELEWYNMRGSHEEAMEKAETEYHRWQTNALSLVEEVYLDNIKILGYRGKNKI